MATYNDLSNDDRILFLEWDIGQRRQVLTDIRNLQNSASTTEVIRKPDGSEIQTSQERDKVKSATHELVLDILQNPPTVDEFLESRKQDTEPPRERNRRERQR